MQLTADLLSNGKVRLHCLVNAEDQDMFKKADKYLPRLCIVEGRTSCATLASRQEARIKEIAKLEQHGKVLKKCTNSLLAFICHQAEK